MSCVHTVFSMLGTHQATRQESLTLSLVDAFVLQRLQCAANALVHVAQN